MPTVNSTPGLPPWPEDMEEALTARQEKLQEIARKIARSKRQMRLGTPIRTRVIRWAVRIAIIAITFWLLCETAIS